MDEVELLAREGIRDTLARYNLSGDRGRVEELAACFTEDGVLDIEGSWRAEGRDEIIRHTGVVARVTEKRDEKTTSKARRLMRHHLTTSGIEITSSDSARAFSYFLVITEAGPDHAGRYVDRLRRDGERWLIEHRRVVIEWWAESSRYNDEANR